MSVVAPLPSDVTKTAPKGLPQASEKRALNIAKADAVDLIRGCKSLDDLHDVFENRLMVRGTWIRNDREDFVANFADL